MTDLVTARRLQLDPVEALTQRLMRGEPLSGEDGRRIAYLLDALSSAVATVRRGDCNGDGAWGFIAAVLERQFPEMYVGEST
ncbi:MAG: hypothetical protein K0R30_2946 [Ornithinibacter sp.]|nr:hypothetical protein [Ornithinibacter sp.]